MPRLPHQQETQHCERSQHVGEDEQRFPVVAIRRHASDRADQERRQHADDEEAADGQTRLGEHRDQRCRCNEVEPVAKETDNLPGPKQTEITIGCHQF